MWTLRGTPNNSHNSLHSNKLTNYKIVTAKELFGQAELKENLNFGFISKLIGKVVF